MTEGLAGLAPRTVWGVQALLLAAGDSLSARFGAVTVRGELSGFVRAASGHCYFTLKDAEGGAAVLRCAMFRRAAALLDFDPGDQRQAGQVELRGRLGVYEPRGELQVVVEAMRRVGAGNLYEEFLRLKARLEALGLFDDARKRVIPREPRCVGVITSTAGAALHDVLTALHRRAPQVAVVIYPSPVQGADAPPALVQALALANQRGEAQTLLLVRGGGSIEDLWAFNDERVVRAVAASAVPVICGVGHETDVTLADLAADLRAATPTAAAELAVPSRDELLQALGAWQRRVAAAAQNRLLVWAQRQDRLALRLGAPAARFAAAQQRLYSLGARIVRAGAVHLPRAHDRQGELAGRLQRAARLALEQRRQQLQRWQAGVEALGPQQVLQRGYAWVLGEDGRAVMQAHQVQPGQRLTAVWADGRARTLVEAVQLDEAGPGTRGG